MQQVYTYLQPFYIMSQQLQNNVFSFEENLFSQGHEILS